jgi:hypothetical protein
MLLRKLLLDAKFKLQINHQRGLGTQLCFSDVVRLKTYIT